jgi:hypothetical protein
MKHFLLYYDVCSDYMARRGAYRDVHLTKCWAAHERGELLLGGALENPADGGVLLFQGESPRVAESFAEADPYVLNGLVTCWRAKEWITVAGRDAATPIHPAPV